MCLNADLNKKIKNKYNYGIGEKFSKKDAFKKASLFRDISTISQNYLFKKIFLYILFFYFYQY